MARAAAPAVEEQTEFTVVLKSGGEKKIQVIKVVRELTSLGLKEAKELVDNGGTVKEGVPKAEADEMKKKLEDQGARRRAEVGRRPIPRCVPGPPARDARDLAEASLLR